MFLKDEGRITIIITNTITITKCYYSILDKVMEKGQLMIWDITPTSHYEF